MQMILYLRYLPLIMTEKQTLTVHNVGTKIFVGDENRVRCSLNIQQVKPFWLIYVYSTEHIPSEFLQPFMREVI